MTPDSTDSRDSRLPRDDVTSHIIDAALQIHKELGPGLLESVYEAILARRLAERGLHVERQKAIDFVYDGVTYHEGFRIDLLVEHEVVVELKSIEQITAIHSKKLLTYLKLLNAPVGLVVNFGGVTLKEGLKRVVNSCSFVAPPHLNVLRHATPFGREA
jgi:GxxExxY protein